MSSHIIQKLLSEFNKIEGVNNLKEFMIEIKNIFLEDDKKNTQEEFLQNREKHTEQALLDYNELLEDAPPSADEVQGNIFRRLNGELVSIKHGVDVSNAAHQFSEPQELSFAQMHIVAIEDDESEQDEIESESIDAIFSLPVEEIAIVRTTIIKEESTDKIEEVVADQEEIASAVEEVVASAVEEVVASAVEEVVAPAVEEVVAPAVEEVVAPAVEEVVAPVVEEVVAPAVEEVVAPAVEEVVAPAVEEVVAPLAEEEVAPPHRIPAVNVNLDTMHEHKPGFLELYPHGFVTLATENNANTNDLSESQSEFLSGSENAVEPQEILEAPQAVLEEAKPDPIVLETQPAFVPPPPPFPGPDSFKKSVKDKEVEVEQLDEPKEDLSSMPETAAPSAFLADILARKEALKSKNVATDLSTAQEIEIVPKAPDLGDFGNALAQKIKTVENNEDKQEDEEKEADEWEADAYKYDLEMKNASTISNGIEEKFSSGIYKSVEAKIIQDVIKDVSASAQFQSTLKLYQDKLPQHDSFDIAAKTESAFKAQIETLCRHELPELVKKDFNYTLKGFEKMESLTAADIAQALDTRLNEEAFSDILKMKLSTAAETFLEEGAMFLENGIHSNNTDPHVDAAFKVFTKNFSNDATKIQKMLDADKMDADQEKASETKEADEQTAGGLFNYLSEKLKLFSLALSGKGADDTSDEEPCDDDEAEEYMDDDFDTDEEHNAMEKSASKFVEEFQAQEQEILEHRAKFVEEFKAQEDELLQANLQTLTTASGISTKGAPIKFDEVIKPASLEGIVELSNPADTVTAGESFAMPPMQIDLLSPLMQSPETIN